MADPSLSPEPLSAIKTRIAALRPWPEGEAVIQALERYAATLDAAREPAGRDAVREALRLATALGVDLVRDHRGIPYDVIERVDAIATALADPAPGGEDAEDVAIMRAGIDRIGDRLLSSFTPLDEFMAEEAPEDRGTVSTTRAEERAFLRGYDTGYRIAEDRAEGLDAAWAEAEAALPEGWVIREGHPWRDRDFHGSPVWRVAAGPPDRFGEGGHGPTPADALRALATRLRATTEAPE